MFTAVTIDNQIVRQGPGNLYIRMPRLPENDSDVLDVDDELCFAAARYICSFVSREKNAIHLSEAQRIIRMYNNKVQTFFENLDQDGKLEEYDDLDKFGKKEYP